MTTNEKQASDGERRGFFRRLGRFVPFARSSVGGKKDAYIKFRVNGDVKDAIARKAHAMGFASESEFCELALSIVAFGEGHLEKVQRERLQRVATLVPGSLQPNATVIVKGGDDAAR